MFGKPHLKLILVRHGQTENNRHGRIQGRLDAPLNETGREQARRLAETLADRTINHVYSSPARRAYQTAEILNEQWQAVMTTDERLWEIDHKNWEGKSIAELPQTDPDNWAKWIGMDGYDDLHNPAPHGGETVAQARRRVGDWLDEVAPQHRDQTLVAVGHGGCLQALLCYCLQTQINRLWPYQFGNAGMAEVWMYDQGASLMSLS